MSRPRKAGRKNYPPNLYRRTDGYFFYRNPRSGKIKGLGHDQPTAFREARQANAALAALTPSDLVGWINGVTELTLKEWAPKYKAEWVEKDTPAASTLRNQLRYLERIEKADCAWMPLRSITTAHIATFLDSVEAESGPATSRLIRARLSDMFRMAETKGMIDVGKNPVTATAKANYEVSRERLSLEQFLAIRAKVGTWLRNAMDLALLTAQRREDIAVMRFEHEKGGYLFVEQGKTGVRLQLDTSIRLAAVGMSIGDVIKQCRDNYLSPYMVHRGRAQGPGKPGDPMSVGTITNAFAQQRDALQIVVAEGRTPPSFHEIRSLSERLYRKEYGAEFAQAMLGHKTATMTANYNDLRGSGWQVVGAKS